MGIQWNLSLWTPCWCEHHLMWTQLFPVPFVSFPLWKDLWYVNNPSCERFCPGPKAVHISNVFQLFVNHWLNDCSLNLFLEFSPEIFPKWCFYNNHIPKIEIILRHYRDKRVKLICICFLLPAIWLASWMWTIWNKQDMLVDNSLRNQNKRFTEY